MNQVDTDLEGSRTRWNSGLLTDNCLSSGNVPDWMVEGHTILLMKDPNKDVDQMNYRPMLLKLLTSIFIDKNILYTIYFFIYSMGAVDKLFNKVIEKERKEEHLQVRRNKLGDMLSRENQQYQVCCHYDFMYVSDNICKAKSLSGRAKLSITVFAVTYHATRVTIFINCFVCYAGSQAPC